MEKDVKLREETFLDGLNAIVTTLTTDLGLSEHQAKHFKSQLLQHIQNRYGGERVYIHAKNKRERARQILAAFQAGSDVNELVKRFNISRRRVYQILEKRH